MQQVGLRKDVLKTLFVTGKVAAKVPDQWSFPISVVKYPVKLFNMFWEKHGKTWKKRVLSADFLWT
jgi:hypothetical protein